MLDLKDLHSQCVDWTLTGLAGGALEKGASRSFSIPQKDRIISATNFDGRQGQHRRGRAKRGMEWR